MFIKSVKLSDFRRFQQVAIEIPNRSRLVIVSGPNGSGKSALFDAFGFWRRHRCGWGMNDFSTYYSRIQEGASMPYERIQIEFHDFVARNQAEENRRAIYVRSAY
jgi:ABC-type lipoprotein export system ATPase subunit